MEALLSVGQIARELTCPIWRIQYLLRARDIKPTCRVGILRLFTPNTVDTLRTEIEAIERRRKLA